MLVKVVAKGLVLHPHAYLRNGWDVLDFIIVATSLLSLGLSVASGGEENDALKSVRLVRSLRPLRLVRRWEGPRGPLGARAVAAARRGGGAAARRPGGGAAANGPPMGFTLRDAAPHSSLECAPPLGPPH